MASRELAGGFVRRDDTDGVITFTLTRVDKLNAVTEDMLAALEEAVNDLANDPAHKVLVITGEGRFFTAGMDLSLVNPSSETPDGIHRTSISRHSARSWIHRILDLFEVVERPVVVAFQGNSLGLGIELAASCDYRLAAEGVRLSLPELPHIGIPPSSGGMSRLTRLIGPHWAKWLVAGIEITAQEALHIGLMHAVYPAETFQEQVQDFARRLAELPSEAFGLCKLAIDAAGHIDRRAARDLDRLALTMVQTSDEFAARIAQMADDR